MTYNTNDEAEHAAIGGEWQRQADTMVNQLG